MNQEIILLYWDIGRGIVEKQQTLGWGDSVVEMVAADLRRAFPEMRGWSPAERVADEAVATWPTASERFLATGCREKLRPSFGREPNSTVLAQLVPENRWLCSGHQTTNSRTAVRELAAASRGATTLLILKKLDDPAARLYYLRATARFGWTRNVLLNQIKAGAYERAVVEKKTHNFDLVLPEHLAEQADEMLKSSYNLEFLGLRRAVRERELEDRLISRLQAFILELGYGFCFVGRQYRLVLGKRSTSSICCSTTASSGRWWPSI